MDDKNLEFFDFNGVLDDSKKTIEFNVAELRGKIDFIDQLKKFFADNSLAVIKINNSEIDHE